MVIIWFFFEESQKKVWFFKENFLLANINIKILLKMPFLFLNNTNI